MLNNLIVRAVFTREEAIYEAKILFEMLFHNFITSESTKNHIYIYLRFNNNTVNKWNYSIVIIFECLCPSKIGTFNSIIYTIKKFEWNCLIMQSNNYGKIKGVNYDNNKTEGCWDSIGHIMSVIFWFLGSFTSYI